MGGAGPNALVWDTLLCRCVCKCMPGFSARSGCSLAGTEGRVFAAALCHFDLRSTTRAAHSDLLTNRIDPFHTSTDTGEQRSGGGGRCLLPVAVVTIIIGYRYRWQQSSATPLLLPSTNQGTHSSSPRAGIKGKPAGRQHAELMRSRIQGPPLSVRLCSLQHHTRITNTPQPQQEGEGWRTRCGP